jgi:hypothetical protein
VFKHGYGRYDYIRDDLSLCFAQKINEEKKKLDLINNDSEKNVKQNVSTPLESENIGIKRSREDLEGGDRLEGKGVEGGDVFEVPGETVGSGDLGMSPNQTAGGVEGLEGMSDAIKTGNENENLKANINENERNGNGTISHLKEGQSGDKIGVGETAIKMEIGEDNDDNDDNNDNENDEINENDDVEDEKLTLKLNMKKVHFSSTSHDTKSSPYTMPDPRNLNRLFSWLVSSKEALLMAKDFKPNSRGNKYTDNIKYDIENSYDIENKDLIMSETEMFRKLNLGMKSIY